MKKTNLRFKPLCKKTFDLSLEIGEKQNIGCYISFISSCDVLRLCIDNHKVIYEITVYSYGNMEIKKSTGQSNCANSDYVCNTIEIEEEQLIRELDWILVDGQIAIDDIFQEIINK